MALDYHGLLRDLEWETDQLTGALSCASIRVWETPTPADGWAVRDQISHLAVFDDYAHTALTDADRFREQARALTARGTNFPDLLAIEHRHLSPTDLLEWFTESRNRLLEALAADDPRRRLPWFGPDMSVASSATARLMETWAHGQDVYDTLGVTHPIGPGLRSIAHLGVSTFAFAFRLNGQEVPEAAVRVELTAPNAGDLWTWGPDDAENRVTGPAEDFVLAVTQRRHPSDTALAIEGDIASAWMRIAQAYAGAPGTGRPTRATTR